MTHSELKEALQYAQHRLRGYKDLTLWLTRETFQDVWKVINVDHLPDANDHAQNTRSRAVASLQVHSLQAALQTADLVALEEFLVMLSTLDDSRRTPMTLEYILEKIA